MTEMPALLNSSVKKLEALEWETTAVHKGNRNFSPVTKLLQHGSYLGLSI